MKNNVKYIFVQYKVKVKKRLLLMGLEHINVLLVRIFFSLYFSIYDHYSGICPYLCNALYGN